MSRVEMVKEYKALLFSLKFRIFIVFQCFLLPLLVSRSCLESGSSLMVFPFAPFISYTFSQTINSPMIGFDVDLHCIT